MAEESCTAHNPDNCPLQAKLLKLEQDYNELHKNLQLSATYGSSLLDENSMLKQQIQKAQSIQDQANQEIHHLKMHLEVAQKFQLSQSQEVEAMKEVMQKFDEINQQLKSQDEEQHRKELSHASELAGLKEQEEARAMEYEARIKELQSEIQQLKTAPREQVMVSCEHESEISQLQMELELSKQSKSKLEEDLISSQNQVQQGQVLMQQLQHKMTESERELQAKEKELASTEKLLEEKRMEVLDLQALLETERVSQTDPEKRGNSIFSEVEDRRQQVERHLSKLTALLDKEKRKNQDLQAEIVKVKNQMAFLACGGSNSEPSRSSEQMENLLRSSNAQNKDLLKKIEELEQKLSHGQSLPSHPMPQLEDSRKWMQAMLTQKQEENDKLRGEVRDHIRAFLCQTDQTMQLTKRLAETEKNLQRARSEVFRLKTKIEDMVTNNTNGSSPADLVSPVFTVPPTRVVENLQSVLDAEKQKEDQLSSSHLPEKPLRERVVLQQAQLSHHHQTNSNNPHPAAVVQSSQAASQEIRMEKEGNAITTTTTQVLSTSVCTPTRDDNVGDLHQGAPVSTIKGSGGGGGSGVKRQVRMNTEVRAVYEDGDSTVENLAEDKFTAGAKKPSSMDKKPVGQQVEVVDVSTAAPAMECNQQ